MRQHGSICRSITVRPGGKSLQPTEDIKGEHGSGILKICHKNNLSFFSLSDSLFIRPSSSLRLWAQTEDKDGEAFSVFKKCKKKKKNRKGPLRTHMSRADRISGHWYDEQHMTKWLTSGVKYESLCKVPGVAAAAPYGQTTDGLFD